MSIPTETERKFLLRTLPELGAGVNIIQGYLCKKGPTVRVRIADAQAFLTIKGKRQAGALGKKEFEYPIPLDHAQWMVDNLCDDRVIHKVRHLVHFANYVYEVDVFGGNLKGMIVAELEYPDSAEVLMLNHPKPDWLGQEVTDDKEYTNKSLAKTQEIPFDYKGPK